MRDELRGLPPKADSFLSGQEYDRLVNACLSAKKILDKYSGYCPNNFEAEVNISVKLNSNKIVQNDKFSGITCQKKNNDFNTCLEGYVKSYYDYGYFGCVKYAGCKETNPRYIKAGDGCVECDAGGCVDQDMFYRLNLDERKESYQFNVGTVCRVNYKNPANTPACPEYRVTKGYDIEGRLKDEYFLKFERRIKQHRYDKDGRLEAVTEYNENDMLVRAYDAEGKTKEEVVMDVYCDNKLCEEYLYNFKTKQKKIIKKYVYSKEGKISEEFFYKEGDPVKRHRYDKNGKFETVTEYKDGIPFIEYYADGTPKEERVERAYDTGGRMSSEYVYNNKTGKVIRSRIYDMSGEVQLSEYEYNGDVRITKQRKYNKDGTLKEEMIWENLENTVSAPVWSITTIYDRDGKIISKKKTAWDPAQWKHVTYPCPDGVCS